MSARKPSPRSSAKAKLEPIDWHELANDAVLNGNMSTLYHRPASEDFTSYASDAALQEIERRSARPTTGTKSIPTVGTEPTVGINPISPSAFGATTEPIPSPEVDALIPGPTVGTEPIDLQANAPRTHSRRMPNRAISATSKAAPFSVEESDTPTVGRRPTVGPKKRGRKSIRDVQDALTLAGQILYKAMYGAPDGARAKTCTKGYRQLAAETHLDKDTVRDLIVDLKDKGIVSEVGTYNADTRTAKTYEVLSYKAILQLWREAGILFVIPGRKPQFCNALGEPLFFRPTGGREATGSLELTRDAGPTAAMAQIDVLLTPRIQFETDPAGASVTDLVEGLQQILGGSIDQQAADRLLHGCRSQAPDCTIPEILEFAWSKAFLCRSGRITNPIGFLITQVPKHFEGEAFRTYRQAKRKQLEAAAVAAAQEEERRLEHEREIAEFQERYEQRVAITEKFRTGQGIDLKELERSPEADEAVKDWARRMLKLGHRFQPKYD